MTWQPIETAPPETDLIVAVPSDFADLGFVVGEARHWSSEVSDGDKGWWWAGAGPHDWGCSAISPTHWQPLPEPPAVERDLTKEAVG